jgi:hypothetical protein
MNEETNQSKNRIDNIPKQLQGNIQKILKDPFVSERRRLNAYIRLQDNKFAFKNGKYLKKSPQYCDNCPVSEKCKFYEPRNGRKSRIICVFTPKFKAFFNNPDNCGNREENAVNDYINATVEALLHRAGMLSYFEALSGGKANKNVTKSLLDVMDKLNTINSNDFSQKQQNQTL